MLTVKDFTVTISPAAGSASEWGHVILIVCEGNVCRSPLAALVLVQALHEHQVPIEIASAGTHALVGQPIEPPTAEVARRLGVRDISHEARQLTPDLLCLANLVLTADRNARSQAVRMYPPAVQYTFTILQAGRILSAADSGPPEPPDNVLERTVALRRFIQRERSSRAASRPELDDLKDPYRQPLSEHEALAQQMMPAIGLISAALGAPRRQHREAS